MTDSTDLLAHEQDAGRFPSVQVHRLDAASFVRLVRHFGADRVLFGTDSPWADQRASVAEILALPLTDEEKQAILSRNAGKLLKMLNEKVE